MSDFQLQRPLFHRKRCEGSAGVMILAKDHPRVIRCLSTEPELTPQVESERHEIVPNVAFRTDIDRRSDIGNLEKLLL